MSVVWILSGKKKQKSFIFSFFFSTESWISLYITYVPSGNVDEVPSYVLNTIKKYRWWRIEYHSTFLHLEKSFRASGSVFSPPIILHCPREKALGCNKVGIEGKKKPVSHIPFSTQGFYYALWFWSQRMKCDPFTNVSLFPQKQEGQYIFRLIWLSYCLISLWFDIDYLSN